MSRSRPGHSSSWRWHGLVATGHHVRRKRRRRAVGELQLATLILLRALSSHVSRCSQVSLDALAMASFSAFPIPAMLPWLDSPMSFTSETTRGSSLAPSWHSKRGCLSCAATARFEREPRPRTVDADIRRVKKVDEHEHRCHVGELRLHHSEGSSRPPLHNWLPGVTCAGRPDNSCRLTARAQSRLEATAGGCDWGAQ